MAWETINYSCGHTADLQMYGPHKDRESKKEWLERSGVCPECYKAKKDEERKQADVVAAEKNATRPALKGSEKQIAWAEKLRAYNYDIFVAAKKRGEEAMAGGHNPGDAEKQIFDFVVAAGNCTSAKWWIDNREAIGVGNLGTIQSVLSAMARKWGVKELKDVAARAAEEIKNMN